MPKYNLNIAGRSITSVETDAPLSRAIGRRLQGGQPDTRAETGGSLDRSYFDDKPFTRSDLREVKAMRESGGIVAELMDAKALMKFGSGAKLQSDDDDLQNTLNSDLFPHIDTLILDLGMDAVWYPFAIGETVESRGGGFSHIEPVEPWTMLPGTDDRGQIVAWEQEVRSDSGPTTETFRADDLGHIVINKASGRDDIGISDALQNKEEIEQYRDNQQAIRQAVEVAGFPHNHWKVGAEGASVISDSSLRRVRNIVQRIESDSQIVTGRDIEHEQIEPTSFDFSTIAEHDLKVMTGALGVPIELANFGSDGLGSGMPAEFRMDMLALKNEVHRRYFGDQFVAEFVRPIVREYTPHDHTADITLQIDPFLDDQSDVAELIQSVGDYMRTEEVREKLDLPELDDEETRTAFRSPAQIERDEEGTQPEPGGGIFGSVLSDTGNRTLQAIEDIDTVPPEGVQEQASMALRWREETGNPNDCGTQTGWTRANQLQNGESLSEDTINRMVSFFARHEHDQEPDESKKDCSRMMWKSWGGDPGKDWAEAKQAEFENARENRALSVPDDDPFLELWNHAIATDDTDRQLVFSSTGTPEFVKDRLREAIRGGALFSQFDGVPSDKLMDMRQTFTDTLTEDGWTIDDMTDAVQELQPSLSEGQAETIARTETASVLNTAREEGYEDQFDMSEERFYWTNPLDNRTTDACEWLTEKTNPNHGGDPVPLDELRELIDEAPEHDDEMQDSLARPDDFVVHPSERSTWVRAVE